MAESERDQDILKWVLACRQEADEARHTKLALMQESWRAYFNDYDFSRKADWQTKVAVPLWAMGVDQLAGVVQSALLQAARLFSIEVLSPDPLEIARAKIIHDLLHLMLHDARLPRVIGDGARVGAITNLMIFKARVEDRVRRYKAPRFVEVEVGVDPETGMPHRETRLDTETVAESRLALDIPVLNPRHFYLDPRGRNLYRIQEGTRDVSYLQDPIIRRTWRSDAIQAALSEGGDAPLTEQEEAEGADMQALGLRNPLRRQVRILEYWGPIYNGQGRKIREDSWVVILNERHVALVDDYPFWHGQDPFVVSNLIPLPFTPWGKLLFQHVGPLGSLVTEMLCLIADANKYATLGAFAIDTNQLENVDEIVGGLFPGITIHSLGPNPIQQIRFQGTGAGEQAFIAELRQLFENGMATAEFLTGAPSIRGRATATEVQTKTAATSSFMESLTMAMQFDGLEPLIEKCYWNTIQYLDNWAEPRLQALAQKHGLDPVLLGGDPVTRYRLLRGAFKFHVSALTGVLRRVEITERLLRLVELVGSRPEFLQLLGPVKVQQLFNKVLEVFQFEELITAGNQMPGVMLPQEIAGGNAPPIPGTPFALPPGNVPPFGAALRERG